MLQSQQFSLQHIPQQHTPTSTLLPSQEQQKSGNTHYSINQRKIAIENDKKKWDITEFTEWLCFVVRQSINSPYQDLETVLMSSKNGDQSFDDLSRTIVTKNSKQCARFSRKMIKEVRSRTEQGLLTWCVKKLRKQTETPKILELLSQYDAFTRQKSPYMQILSKMSEYYSPQELEQFPCSNTK